MTDLLEPEPKYSRTAYADGPRLLADIGATHARFALETAPGVMRAVRVLKCDDYSDILALLREYLSDHEGVRLNHAAFALANPINGDFIRMTNRDWQFSTDEVRRALGLTTLLIVNDFTALAMSLPNLPASDLVQVGGGKPAANAVIGVLGPGTGLGCSGVIPTLDGFVTLGSEGGHANFAPADEREFAILQYAWKEWSHVSNERLISGPGMEIIYRALALRNGVDVEPLTSPEIITGALERQDMLCLEVLDCFCGMLGGAAANLAVTLGSFGGIFIGGGIVPRLGDWFVTSSFRKRFEAKGRFTSYLAEIPTFVIMTPNPAFHGVASILSEHLRGRSGANTLMERVQHLQHELSPAEQRVATLVIDHPRKVLGLSLIHI